MVKDGPRAHWGGAFKIEVDLEGEKGGFVRQETPPESPRHHEPTLPEGRIYPEMDELPELSLDNVLENLARLYGRKQPWSPGSGWCSIYSSVGPILVAMNPFIELPLYSNEWIQAYRNAGQQGEDAEIALRALGPHCYRTAEQAYLGLRNSRQQSIVICGESGAGKTVTNRKMLEYLLGGGHATARSNTPSQSLTAVHGEVADRRTGRSKTTPSSSSFIVRTTSAPSQQPADSSSIETGRTGRANTFHFEPATRAAKSQREISQANALLEFFGNAKTVRNDNSSRFGKYSQLLYSDTGYVVRGFEIKHYMLERSRVVAEPPGERNYHIFHQLVKSDMAQTFGLLGGPSAFAYTAAGANVQQIDGTDFDDVKGFEELCESMEAAGFPDATLGLVCSVVAALLHLGNIDFEPSEESCGDHCQVAASAAGSLSKACELLGVEAAGESGFADALVSRKSGKGICAIVKKLGVDGARSQRDAIAKMLYSSMFDYLVNVINKNMARGNRSAVRIGLLDIFGFEDMPVNSFEQMFINLTNERIQYLFNFLVFEREKQVYEDEGFSTEEGFESGYDNWPCIELFIGARGIVKLLADQCKMMTNSGDPDQMFLDTICKHLKDRQHFVVCKPGPDFKRIVKAKKRKWAGKLDVPPMHHEQCFQVRHYAANVTYTVPGFVAKSKDGLPGHLTHALSTSNNEFVKGLLADSEENFVTVGERFADQLKALAAKLEEGNTFFVRCVKPNSDAFPGVIDYDLVLDQLYSEGIVSALEIRQLGYPDRIEFGELCDEVCVLSLAGCMDDKSFCEQVLPKYLDCESFSMGRSRVFFRQGALIRLRSIIRLRKRRAVKILQKFLRKYTACISATKMVSDFGLEFEHENGRFATIRDTVLSHDLTASQPIAEATETVKLLLDSISELLTKSREEQKMIYTPKNASDSFARSITPCLGELPKARQLLSELEELVQTMVDRKVVVEQQYHQELQSTSREIHMRFKQIEQIEAELTERAAEMSAEDSVSPSNWGMSTPQAQESHKIQATFEACRNARKSMDRMMRHDLPQLHRAGPPLARLEDFLAAEPACITRKSTGKSRATVCPRKSTAAWLSSSAVLNDLDASVFQVGCATLSAEADALVQEVKACAKPLFEEEVSHPLIEVSEVSALEMSSTISSMLPRLTLTDTLNEGALSGAASKTAKPRSYAERYPVGQEIYALRSNGSWTPGTVTGVSRGMVTVTFKDGTTKQLSTLHSHHLRTSAPTQESPSSMSWIKQGFRSVTEKVGKKLSGKKPQRGRGASQITHESRDENFMEHTIGVDEAVPSAHVVDAAPVGVDEAVRSAELELLRGLGGYEDFTEAGDTFLQKLLVMKTDLVWSVGTAERGPLFEELSHLEECTRLLISSGEGSTTRTSMSSERPR